MGEEIKKEMVVYAVKVKQEKKELSIHMQNNNKYAHFKKKNPLSTYQTYMV